MTRSGRFSFLSRAAFCGASFLFGSCASRADEFALLPSSDPILRSLASLDSLGDGAKFRSEAQMTRFEAALQVTRVWANTNAEQKKLSRQQWRTLAILIKSLSPELKTLGVNVEEARITSERYAGSKTAVAPKPPVEVPAFGFANQTKTPRPTPDFGSPLLSTFSRRVPSAGERVSANGVLVLPLSGRLRAGAALLSLERAQNDPFADFLTLSRRANPKIVGTSASLSYDFNSWLSFRAQASERNLAMETEKTLLLHAPLFTGARQTTSTGGAVDVQLGSLSLGAELEKFSADQRRLGTRVGGGAQVSAWQNRLSLSAHLSRLVPEDSAALTATAAEFGVGARVTQRLSLNLMYQGLFTAQPRKNVERVAGGLSLSF